MKTETFASTLRSALLENLLVFVGILICVPLIMLARGTSHRGMTIAYALAAGLAGGLLKLRHSR